MKTPAMIAFTIILSALTGCSERSQSSASGKLEFCYLANTGVTVCDSDYNVHGHPTGEAEKRAERKQP